MSVRNLKCHFTIIIVLGAAVFMNACSASLFRQNRVTIQDEAATVHVAVLSVAPWDEYTEAMQPGFKITPEDAIGQVIPGTMAIEEKILDAFAARFKLAMPGATFSDITTTRLEKGETTADTRDITKTLATGDTSKISFADSPAGSRTAAGLAPGSSVLGKSLGIDPMLKYLAATALYQEVQMLNHYIKDAAIGDNVIPYVVRLQMSIMPRMRNEPYDAYTTISFFFGNFSPRGNAAGGDDESKKEQAISGKEGISVVPLLVTDNIEAAIQSRSLNQLRQLGLALSATMYGVGVGTDLQKVDEKLRTVVGSDLNSTFTVARVSENTLRCRFGAMYQAQAQYAMIPQTHNISLLVLVPKSNGADVKKTLIRVVAKTSLTDVDNGKDLPTRNYDEIIAEAAGVLKKYYGVDIQSNGAGSINAHKEVDDMLYYVAANKYENFQEAVNKIVGGKTRHYESVWSEIIAIRSKSPFTTATFSLPEMNHDFIILPDKTITPIIHDDGKNSSTIKLLGKGLKNGNIGAILKVSDGVELAHSNIKASGDGKEVEITFPSLAMYKLKGDGCRLTLYNLKIINDNNSRPVEYHTFNTCIYLPAAESVKPQFNMSTHASLIIADKNAEGKLSITFSSGNEKVGIFFNVKGADVLIEPSAGGPQVVAKKDGWSLGCPGTVHLKLRNLNPISAVTISAKDTNNDASLSPILLPVLSQPGGKQ